MERARARVAPDKGLALAKAPDLLSELIHALPTAPPLWAPGMPGRHGSAATTLHALGDRQELGNANAVKLATSAAFGHDRRVVTVTIDVHRIGGIETLRAFSQILGIPMRKAANRRELIGTLRDLGQCDIVLIDTPDVAIGTMGPWRGPQTPSMSQASSDTSYSRNHAGRRGRPCLTSLRCRRSLLNHRHQAR